MRPRGVGRRSVGRLPTSPMAADMPVEASLRTLDEELERGRALIGQAESLGALQAAESSLLGRKSPLASIQRSLGGLSEEDRRQVGQRTNEVREALRAALADRREAFEAEREAALLGRDR